MFMSGRNKFSWMKKIYNKDELKTSPDYLNFIRRNQQIVREFKELTTIESKSKILTKMHSAIPDTQRTLEVDRYSNNIESSSVSNKGVSLRDIMPSFVGGRPGDVPIVHRQSHFSDDIHADIYTRNYGIPSNPHKGVKDSIQRNEANEEVRLPKLSGRLSQNQNYRNTSDCENSSQGSLEKDIVEPRSIKNQKKKIMKRNTDRSSEWDYLKKNYAPISVDNCPKNQQGPSRCKVKSMKFSDIAKTKLNNKLIRTYYDYENLVELKDRVFELLPTFKPIQAKKRDRDRVQVVQLTPAPGELEKYLQTSMIQKPTIQAALQTRKIKKQSLQNQSEEESTKNIKNTEENNEPETPVLQKKYSTSSPTKNIKKISAVALPNCRNSEQTVYQNKIASYRQFLFMMNFAHRVFHPLVLKEDGDKFKPENRYKYYLGKGNNSLLVKSLLKRRFWWTEVDDPKSANFVWTQLKINTYYQFEPKTSLISKYDKLDEDHPLPEPKKKKLMRSKVKLDSSKKNESSSPTKVGGILRGTMLQGQKRVFTNADSYHLAAMLESAAEQNPQLKHFHKFETRLKHLPVEFLKKIDVEELSQQHVHNHFACNFEIGNKKAMFYNLKHYYQAMGMNPWNTLPLTFHIKKGALDPEFAKFSKQFKRLKNELTKAEKANSSTKKLSKNVWIIKPGELSNRGNGITVVDEMYEINSILKKKEKHTNGQEKTYIIQKYIEKPLLYKNRKFDIRHYMLISRLHGRMRAYWFSQGYIRTSCYEYSIDEVGDEMVHLTNDAIQKNCPAYGKYEEGNKLSYAEFQRYLDHTYPDKKYSFIEQAYPRMREIATDAVRSTYLWMDPDESEHNFEVFGLDFMIDSQFGVWLIEVNTNPCLEISSQLLGRIIPTMLENSLRLGLDPLFPPPAHYANSIKYLAPDNPMDRLQYELIFDEGRDGKLIEEVMRKAGKADCGDIDEEDEVYEDNGKEIQLGGDLQ